MKPLYLVVMLAALPVLGQQPSPRPETVMITLHARPGSEIELRQTIQHHWVTTRRLGLTLEEPHFTLRGDEEGGTYFVEILTWRDASAPDHAPPDVLAIWDQMNGLVEPRRGRPGLELVEVFPVEAAR